VGESRQSPCFRAARPVIEELEELHDGDEVEEEVEHPDGDAHHPP